ncbi:MAG TPA: hypothetical protein VLJ57_04290 [Burkholderiaceae bacterium]|nr:hypothetical protein [Burkholderiaceae bacterium]
MVTSPSVVAKSFQVRFLSLFVQGRALAFPCDVLGQVDLAVLTVREKSNYLLAQSLVGKDYSQPYIWPPVQAALFGSARTH